MLINCVFTYTPNTPGILIVRENATGYTLDASDYTFKQTPAIGYVVPTEDEATPGLYRWTRDQQWIGLYQFIWYESIAQTGAPTIWSIYLDDGEQTLPPDTISERDVNFIWYEYEQGHNGEQQYAISDVKIAVYNNISGSGKPITSGRTDELGKAIFTLDPGVYYLFRRKAGRTFTNPVMVEVG